MSSLESDGKSDWNDLLINAIRKKQGTGKIVTEKNRLHDIVEALDQGADINTADCKSGNTALHIAVRRGFKEVVEFLRQKGASTDIPNLKGETAVTLAENLGKGEIWRILQKPILHRKASAGCEATWATGASTVESLNCNKAKNQPSTSRNSRNVPHDEYEKSKTFAAGATLTKSWPGLNYQLVHLMFTLLCALQHMDPYFLLATEMVEAEKLDDVVLLYKDTSGKQAGRFVQIKYGNNPDAKISAKQLLEAGGNFSVSNYFKSWRKVKKNRLFQDVVSRHMILCTNLGLDLDDLKKNGISCVKAEDPDKSFELKTKHTAWYKVVARKEQNDKVYSCLKATSDIHHLATQLAQRLWNGTPIRLETDIFQCYHVALAKYVFDPKTRQFYDNFIENRDLSPQVQKFREIFISEYIKISGFLENDTSEKFIWNDIIQRFEKLEKFRQDFGKPPQLVPNPQLSRIDELSERLVDLLKKASKNNIVKIVTKQSRPADAAVQPIDVIVDNIDKLSGHVLIEDDKKIKFSSQFLKDSKPLPGNIGDFRTALKKKLPEKYELSMFEFEVQNFKVCTRRQLLAETELPEDYVEDCEISNFLEEFTLAMSQPNEDEINEAIKMKVDADGRFNVHNTELLACALKYKIENWFVKKSERGNEKEYISCKVGEKFLDDLDQAVRSFMTTGVSSKYCERLEAFNLRFKSRMPLVERFLSEDVSHQTSHRILQLLTSRNTSLTASRFYDTLRKIPKYKKMDSFIFVELDDFRLPLVSKSVLSTFNSLQYSDLLVVDCGPNDIEKYTKELWTPLCKIIERHSNKKIIFITQTNTRSITPFLTSHGINIEQILEIADDKHDDYSFRNLADETQKELLEKPVSRFQGHECNTSFGELLGIRKRGNINEAKLQYLSEMINASTLLDLVCQDKIRICAPLESLAEKDYYINRTIRRRVIIKKEILVDEKIPDLFAIRDGREKLPSMSARKMEKFSPMPRNPPKITILARTQEEEQFKALCEKYPHSNIHWLNLVSGKYIWEKSKGDITHLLEYRVSNESNDLYDRSTELTYLTEMNNFDNVNDIATRDTRLPIRDDQMASLDEPVIISSAAGMGKSTMLTYLAWKLKEEQPNMLVIKINLNSHVQAFANVQGKSEHYNICDENGAIDFFVKELLKCETDLARAVIRRMMKNKCKMALIFDGFDEISPNYEETVSSLLQTLVKHGIKKLFVATRPHTGKSLEMKLKVFSHDIQPFQSDNQQEFFNKFIKNDKARIDMAQAVLKKLCESIDDRTGGFTGIPLHTKMIAEILQYTTPGHIETFGRFVDSHHDRETDGSKKIYLIYLYKYFVEMKFDSFFNKRGADPANIDVINQRQSELERFIEMHTQLALDALFDKDKVKEFPFINIDSKTIIERNGIITQFNDDGSPQFGHRSYAEYFAAMFIVNIAKTGNLSDSVREIFAADILVRENYRTMRAFMNCLWAQERGNAFGPNTGDFGFEEHRGSRNQTVLHFAAEEGNGQIIRMCLHYLAMNPENRSAASIAEEITAEFDPISTPFYNSDIVQSSHHNKIPIVDVPDCFGKTPLHIAAWTGQLNVAKCLVENGADVNYPENTGITPLHIGASSGKLIVVKYLFNEGANVESKNKDGMTPLYVAALCGNLNVVEYLLTKGANVNSESNDGSTPLHAAAYQGQLNVVEYLLSNGARVNSESNKSWTPLYTATLQGRLNVVGYLLSKGADVNCQNRNGWTPLHQAAYNGRLDVVEYLLSKGAIMNCKDLNGWLPLHHAASNGKLDIVKYLLSKKVNVDCESKDGATPLMIATMEGQLNVVKYLLSQGANVNSVSEDGSTPLHVAALRGQLNVVEYLLSKQANIDSESKDGSTPLHAAAQEGHLNVVQYLLSKKANVNSRSKDGWTPLYAAAQEGHLNVVKYLLRKGANVNSESNDGFTPLHVAASQGLLNVVKHLLSNGANVNSEEKDGFTPLHLAACQGQLNVVKYLLSKKANVNSKNKDGRTPLHAATRRGQSKVVKYLLSKGAK